jgi:Flp pilus assembly secretin CpaC
VRRIRAYAAPFLLLLAGAVGAEENAQPERTQRLPAPVKVKLVLSIQQDGKKVSSLPYVFPCGDQKSTFKMGVEVPIAVAMAEKAEMMSIQYRNVGTNIECSASAFADGRIRLQLSVEYSSIASVEGKLGLSASGETPSGPASAWLRNPPAFRTTYGNLQLDLRDGQSAQAFLGARPVDGEVVTLDVTLNPPK